MKLFADGPTLQEIKELKVDGYTFNPSLYKKLGAKNYIDFTKQIVSLTKDKSVSVEVIGDNYEECLSQALKLSKISKSFSIKIPIMFTNGSSSKKLIEKLIIEKVNLNITAIFTLEQIKEIIEPIKNTETILSIFAGRIYDIGIDAYKKFFKISEYVHQNSKCKVLWASCRMPYDYNKAKLSNADIITMAPSMIKKMQIFGKKPEEYSKETVIGFYQDALKAGFKIE